MNITKHISEIIGFREVYEEVYESIRKKKELSNGCGFILMRAREVVEEFENKYDVKLLRVGDTLTVGDVIFSFDTVNFKTEENLTMCLLKWS